MTSILVAEYPSGYVSKEGMKINECFHGSSHKLLFETNVSKYIKMFCV